MRYFAFLLTAALAGCLLSDRALAAPQADGLYAVFETSHGAFTAKLHHDLTPRTVANFVALAEGTKEWLSYREGRVVRQKFFDGLTFHRVVQDFVIQGGSPNGQGTDDPGYRFRDEFHPSLRHSKAGILSMANSGPHSNGSQFFVTLKATPHLDDRHSVFGEVVEGMDVVRAIGAVAVGVNEKPLQSVLIEKVTILRVGEAAAQFSPENVQPPLPRPGKKPAGLAKVDSGYALLWEPVVGHEYRLCYSSDLRRWQGGFIGPYRGLGLDDFMAGLSHAFFSVFETKVD